MNHREHVVLWVVRAVTVARDIGVAVHEIEWGETLLRARIRFKPKISVGPEASRSVRGLAGALPRSLSSGTSTWKRIEHGGLSCKLSASQENSVRTLFKLSRTPRVFVQSHHRRARGRASAGYGPTWAKFGPVLFTFFFFFFYQN
jgi:hypothetical protein